MEPSTPWVKIIIFLLIGLLIGGGGGYYMGLLQGKTQGIAEMQRLIDLQFAESESSAASADNPLQGTDENPLNEVQTNPFE